MKHKDVKNKIDNRAEEKLLLDIPFRYILAMAITVLEVLLIIGIVVVFCYVVPYFYIVAWLTEVICVVKIIASDDNPDYKAPWLLVVLVLPIAGFMFYLLFYSRKLRRKFIKRLKEVHAYAYSREDAEDFDRLQQENAVVAADARMLCNIARTHLYSNTKQIYFPLGEDMHRRMLLDLQKAEHFIFLEYFIIEEGKFWNSILDILREKAANGVEIRVVYDDIGCMSTLPGNYARTLRSYGIKATPFSRLRGTTNNEFNNRSHRKILVIDGTIGYTGGVNIADEYINEVERFGHWKDVGLRLEGEAVHDLTQLFLEDYSINVKEFQPPEATYFPPCQTQDASGYLIPFGDGPRPLYNRPVGKSVIQNMLACATKYAWITTPYLIIDHDLCISLENAALRGVDVRIILPHIPDKKIVFAITRSFYPRLMAAGVKIYEYEPGFIHAKTYLVDGDYAMVGTINLDYRSLVHHFENGVWMYRCDCIRDLQADFEETLSRSIAIQQDSIRVGLLRRILRSVIRIFAPLL